MSKCICSILEEPCSESCTCANPLVSGGCKYYAKYGSLEQQIKSKLIKEAIEEKFNKQ